MLIRRNARQQGWRMAAGVCLLLTVAGLLGWLTSWDNYCTDLAFRMRGPVAPVSRIVIVGVDTSPRELLKPHPWPPSIWVRGLQRLLENGAAVVVLDLPDLDRAISPLNSSNPDVQALARTIAGGKVVLPFVLSEGRVSETEASHIIAPFTCGQGELPTPVGPQRYLHLPPLPLAEQAPALGALNIYPEVDGMVRQVPLLISHASRLYPSLALETIRVLDQLPPGSASLRNGQVQLDVRHFPVLNTGELIVNFAGDYTRYPWLPYSEVLYGSDEHLHAQVANAVVLIGPVQGEGFLTTPTSPRLPGVEFQANVVGNLLRGDYLSRTPPHVVFLLLLLACLLTARLALLQRLVVRLAIGGGLLMAFVLVTYSLFLWAHWAPAGAPLLGVLVTLAFLIARDITLAEHLEEQSLGRFDDRLQALAGVAALLDKNLDRHELLHEIMRWVERELNVEACSMLILNHQTQLLRFEVALGPKGDLAKDFTLQLGEGIAGYVAQHNEPVIVNDARRDPRRHIDIPQAINYSMDKVLCVPMTLRGEVVGVLEAMNKRDNSDFTEPDCSLLLVIAQLSALLLENARLYGTLQKRVEFANSELLTAVAQLRREKAKVDALVEEMVDGVLTIDEAERIVLINSAARRMLGLQNMKIDGEPVQSVIQQPELCELLSRSLTLAGGSATAEVDLTGDGRMVARATVVLIEKEADKPSGKCAVLTDVTRFKELDQMKMDLISFVSHELKNPLTTLGLCSKVLRRSLAADKPGEAEEVSQAIERQTLRMRSLVEDLLNLARIEAGRPLEMHWSRLDDVGAMLHDLLQMEAHSAKEHQFELQLPPKVPALWVDQGKLEEVILNLVNNATKYSPGGGRIGIALQVIGGMARFSVEDEGLGMTPEEQTLLFQRFQRLSGASREVTGTGLGLFVCKALVEAHGGGIWVESHKGSGSTFHFTVPLYAGQDATLDGSP